MKVVELEKIEKKKKEHSFHTIRLIWNKHRQLPPDFHFSACSFRLHIFVLDLITIIRI